MLQSSNVALQVTKKKTKEVRLLRILCYLPSKEVEVAIKLEHVCYQQENGFVDPSTGVSSMGVKIGGQGQGAVQAYFLEQTSALYA